MPDEIATPSTDPTEIELLTVANEGDVAAALDAARPNETLVTVIEDQMALLVRRRDTVIDRIDLEAYGQRPTRVKQRTVKVSSSAGFVTATEDRKSTDDPNHVVLYADENTSSLVAVLNDDGPYGPGWRDHRVALKLDATTEWKWWTSRQGLNDQEFFARTIQVGEMEIIDPSPATMLDIAQSFHASTSANVKSAKRLRDGRTQAVYEEDVSATAGEGGTVEIPDTFSLSMRPFYGSDLFKVTARIEWKLASGKLSIGYQLVRPEDVERQAFLKIVEVVSSEMPEVPLVAGAP